MDLENNRIKFRHEFLPLGAQRGRPAISIPLKKRCLVGRSSNCDIVLDYPSISLIHSVIEFRENGECFLFDMSSTNGTYLNGRSVISEKFKLKDKIRFANVEFEFTQYQKDDVLPPPLEMLEALPPILETKARVLPNKALKKDLPRVKYPLAADPGSDYSEYIFEDTDTLYPIFNYYPNKSSSEIIIIFKDKVLSVDYVSTINGVYNLAGVPGGKKNIEFPYLGKTEEVPFIKVSEGQFSVYGIHGFTGKYIGDTKKEIGVGKIVALEKDDIICFQNELIQIYVRGTDAPPSVEFAPILRRDKDFKKYLLLMFLFVFTFLGVFNLYEVDKEKEEEKAPKRIATILYQKKKLVASNTPAIDKTKKKKKTIVQKSPVLERDKTKKVMKKTEAKSKKVTSKKRGEKTQKKVGAVKKVRPRKGPKDNLKIKKVRPMKKRSGAKSAIAKKSKSRSSKSSKSKGAVDTYKSVDFKKSLNRLMAKGSGPKSVKIAGAATYLATEMGGISGGESATLKKADVSNDVGSLTGAASGKLDSTRGVEGLVDKKSIYTAGLPYKTVILGGMDPDIIRKILIDNIPQFRYCYQQELDRASRSFNGVVRLDFVIGASGHVTRAGVLSSSENLPGKVKGCVVNVLKGIRFPEPLGGGVVEVSQPFNFYPRGK